jgi:hypothetical protein
MRVLPGFTAELLLSLALFFPHSSIGAMPWSSYDRRPSFAGTGWLADLLAPEVQGGRPPIPPELRSLIRRMAAENPLWGEERIANELFVKLGIRVSPRTVGKYMPKRPPGQPRGDQRWSTFLKNHAKTILACDFFCSRKRAADVTAICGVALRDPRVNFRRHEQLACASLRPQYL